MTACCTDTGLYEARAAALEETVAAARPTPGYLAAPLQLRARHLHIEDPDDARDLVLDELADPRTDEAWY